MLENKNKMICRHFMKMFAVICSQSNYCQPWSLSSCNTSIHQ